MSLLDIHVLGSPVLRKDTTIVPAVTDDIRRLVDDMFETMYVAKGIGLAAPQVGRLERVAVIDVGEDVQPFAIINPEIILQEGSVRGEEGCLSIPEVYGEVERFARVKVRAMDVKGERFEVEATELLSRCLQHEIDHLFGKLFLDKLGMIRRRAAMTKWEKIRKEFPGNLRTLSAKDVADHHNEEAL